ncbi:MAG: hypothetical protein LBT89_12455, partial [Planctomycetaceae bacterium]|nr:hypothetical protein [Planctomycetaceae bacterium]
MLSLRRVCVHNLKNIDIDLPRKKIIVFCGRSGSGKTSLAIDTLYAEGQRRYIETFSPAMRQFLEKIEKPDAERLDGIPPAVAVTRQENEQHGQTTVGEATEITDYLKQVLQKAGHIFCPKCGNEIKADSPESIWMEIMQSRKSGTSSAADTSAVLIAFEPPLEDTAALFADVWKEQGFQRAMYRDTVFRLDEPIPKGAYKKGVLIIVDRINVNDENAVRAVESLETAMEFGSGICTVKRDGKTSLYSRRFTCEACGIHSSSPRVERRLNADYHSPGIRELTAMTAGQLTEYLTAAPFNDWQRQRIKYDWEQIFSRSGYLQRTGLGSLTLDKLLADLTGSERQRVVLTSALTSPLVDMLYVLDEPSLGLTAAQTEQLLGIIKQLRDRGNTVIIIDHHPVLLLAAEHIVEFGPGAGADGGNIVFQGTVREMLNDEKSLTGMYLNQLRNNVTQNSTKINGLSADFDYQKAEQSVFLTRTPQQRALNSNPVTYLKIFDEIRNVFADTPEAKARNITARHFSFNVPAGRCEHCKGSGMITVKMQFLPDRIVRCSECMGRRYQQQVLEILYRSKTISDVLDMTVREAFSFFRGQSKVQKGLKRLLDTGLDYLPIGQPANTLSGGERQRLHLAVFLTGLKGGGETIYLDEPTAGLHFADIEVLLGCFR